MGYLDFDYGTASSGPVWTGGYIGWSGGDKSKSKYKSSLGWDSGRFTSSTISSFFGGGSGDSIDKVQEVIKRAYDSIRDMIVILDFPFRVNLIFSNRSFQQVAGEKSIFIPSIIFDDDSYKTEDQISIFCGLGVHEAAHLRYTEYSIAENFIKKAPAIYGLKYPINDDNVPFLKFLFNLIEDERAEDNLLQERPGYVDFIDKQKLYLYKSIVRSKIMKSDMLDRFVKNLYRVIRYPEDIEEPVISKYSATFLKIKDILSEKSTCTKDSCALALKILSAIYETFSDLEFNLFKTEIEVACKSGLFDMAGFNEISAGIDGSVDMAEFLHNHGESLISGKLESGGVIEKLVLGDAEYGSSNKTIFFKMKGDSSAYNREKTLINKYVNGIKKTINGKDKNYEFVIPSCRSGKLDTSKLAEAYQGVPQVYTRIGKVETNKTTVCVLIDESGSMRNYCRKGSDTRSVLARRAAILLNEAFGKMPGVDLYIYGHTADRTASRITEINVYREGKYYNPSCSLSESDAHYNNRDGDAILETAKRVRNFTDSRCIMFVLSDGQPAAHGYNGVYGIQDTHNKVKEAERMGFDVIQVSICKVPGVEKMFDKYIEIGDISELPKNLSGIVKKTVLKNKKTKITR